MPVSTKKVQKVLISHPKSMTTFSCDEDPPKSGDTTAENFYQAHLDQARRLAISWGYSSAEQAWDDVHEVFLEFFERYAQDPKSYTLSREEYLVRVRTTAGASRKRNWRVRQRSAPVEEAHDVPDPAPGAVKLLMDQQSVRLAQQILDALPKEEKELLRLHFYGGQSQVEIAQVLGVNQATISRRLSKALTDCRTLAPSFTKPPAQPSR